MSICRSNYPPAKRIVTASLGVLLGLSSVSISVPVQAYAATGGAVSSTNEATGTLDTFRFYSSDSQGTVLSGAIYEILQDGRKVQSVSSTTDEYVEVTLPHGNYTIRLASPPQSFKETSNTIVADTSSLDANHKASYQIRTVFVKSEKLSNLPLSGDHGHTAGDSDSHVPAEGPKDNPDTETSMTETHTIEEIAPTAKGRDRYYQIHLVDEDGEPLQNFTVQATVEEAFSFLDKDGTQKTYNKGDVIEFTTRADGYSDKLFVGSKDLPAQEGTTNITSEVMPKLNFSADNFTFSPSLFGVDPTLGSFEDPDTAPILWTWEGRRSTPIVYTYKGDPELEVGKSRTVDEEETIYVGTKPTRERVTIPHETLEPKEGYTIVPGKDGSKDVVTTYTVDPKTSELTPKKYDENVVPAVDDSYQKQEDTTSEKPEQPNSVSTSEDTANQDSSTDAQAETNSEGTPSDTKDSPDTSEDSKATPTTSGQGQKLPQTGAGILAQVLGALGSAGVGFGMWRYRKNVKQKSDS